MIGRSNRPYTLTQSYLVGGRRGYQGEEPFSYTAVIPLLTQQSGNVGIMSNESSNAIGLVLALAFDDSLNLGDLGGDLF
ncbi:hypothetical protein QL093DRAFT_1087390 [Fusarium oxysporum]|nr:hypothetical protein QL093DRAFT_1087390 [Fusarium oxysporum]